MTNPKPNIDDELNNIESHATEAAKKRAEAAKKRAEADETLRKELAKLGQLIKDYDTGLTVCPAIKALMDKHPQLKECYPQECYQELWNKCALT